MFFLNVSLYKIIEETRPLYYTLSKGLFDIMYDIFCLIRVFIKQDNQEINYCLIYQDILLKIILLIGFCIYSEIIILNFCGLDRNTYKQIIERSIDDTLGLISFGEKE